ncbi:hypothetical protein FACS1894182_11700 [Bacteroidia bacterium]|nr:hypothetical protein FACS1894182_11700 [Bacteroidia bacterium]
MDMMLCYSAAEKEWDAELNKYYKLLMGILSQESQGKLLAAQRLWLKFRDSENTFSTDMYYGLGGTMWRIVATQRSMDIVKTRALELKEYYENLTRY